MASPSEREKLEQIYQEPSGAVIKNCRTCAHCSPDNLGPKFDHCLIGANYCSLVKKFNQGCDYTLRSWTPIPAKSVNFRIDTAVMFSLMALGAAIGMLVMAFLI